MLAEVEHLGLVSRGTGQTTRFGRELGRALQPGDLILLEGQLGAGKTTLVQGLAEGAGARERATSPSFTLINEYRGRLPIYHVDLFRLTAMDLEMEQALEDCEAGEGATIVEWPNLLPSDLKEGALRIQMRVLADEERGVVLHLEGSRWRPEEVGRFIHVALLQPPDGAEE